jgi:integrase
MIPASFSAIRGITTRGSWPGSDSRHDDPCPLVTLRGYRQAAAGTRGSRVEKGPLPYGMRRGEVLGLPSQDIDFDRQVIRIRQQVHRAAGDCTSARSRRGPESRPTADRARLCRADRSAGSPRGPTESSSAPHGLTPGWYLRPAPAGRLNLAISCDPSRASASNTAFL